MISACDIIICYITILYFISVVIETLLQSLLMIDEGISDEERDLHQTVEGLLETMCRKKVFRDETSDKPKFIVELRDLQKNLKDKHSHYKRVFSVYSRQHEEAKTIAEMYSYYIGKIPSQHIVRPYAETCGTIE